MDKEKMTPEEEFWENIRKFNKPLTDLIESGYFDIGPKIFDDYDKMKKPKPMQAAEVAMMDGDLTLCDFIQAIEMIRDQKTRRGDF